LGKIFLHIISCLLLLQSCSRNAITGRNQLKVYSESEIQSMAADQYRNFLATHTVIDPSSGNHDAIMLQRVGEKLLMAIKEYYKSLPDSTTLASYKWEFKLVDSKQPNCWCLPGGKIAVYTGFLSVTQDEACLAIALSHEITHVLAKHVHPKISQPVADQLGGLGLSVSDVNQPKDPPPVNTNPDKVFPDTEGLIPFSRKQELEADRLGLQLAAMAGYDPQEGLRFWKRAKMTYVNDRPIPWITTHPLDNKRLGTIPQEISHALPYFRH
jgi:predicted Zn-dependent protease